ncbi:MAG TPA: DNA-binding protein [Alphaproteobacteria bacterium]|nr:DNA-binding protein [Alphaproteobacteria bacterium]HIO02906.1 DNA-binding protein [Alphaproteobacteria bacterium]
MTEYLKILQTPASAPYLELSPSTLAKMRLRGDGAIYSKCGPRIIVYDVQDLDSYLSSREQRSTNEFCDT